MYRWVEIPLKEEIRLNIDLGGYKYVMTEYGSSLVKCHADVHRSFQEKIYSTEFSRNDSFIKPKFDKTIILFGHDEAIFIKYHYWSGRDRDNTLIPKSEGMGLMVSSIQSSEFGFGF